MHRLIGKCYKISYIGTQGYGRKSISLEHLPQPRFHGLGYSHFARRYYDSRQLKGSFDQSRDRLDSNLTLTRTIFS